MLFKLATLCSFATQYREVIPNVNTPQYNGLYTTSKWTRLFLSLRRRKKDCYDAQYPQKYKSHPHDCSQLEKYGHISQQQDLTSKHSQTVRSLLRAPGVLSATVWIADILHWVTLSCEILSGESFRTRISYWANQQGWEDHKEKDILLSTTEHSTQKSNLSNSDTPVRPITIPKCGNKDGTISIAEQLCHSMG